MSWWGSRRRLRVDNTAKALLGVDPKTQGSLDELQAQQFRVAEFVRICVDGGFDKLALIQNLIVGAVWLADNEGVSREQLAQVIHAIELKANRQLIYKPGD